MKTLFVVVASLFAMGVQAQTTFEYFSLEDNWPAIGECPLCSNIIVQGEVYCTGGGESTPTGCVDGNGIHIRDAQGISCLSDPVTGNWRVEGMAWWELAANWDSLSTGPVSGIWRIVPMDPEDCPDMSIVTDPENYWDDIDIYWEGTYTGKREYVFDPDDPYAQALGGFKWVSTLKLIAQGMGGALVGQKMHAIETITTYYPAPLPGEAFGIAAPKGAAEVTIKTKY